MSPTLSRRWQANESLLPEPTRPLLIVPGLGNSGPGHWQSLWESSVATASRVLQADWDEPDLEIWLACLRRRIEKCPGAVIVAHSLGCALLAHLASRWPAIPVAAAFLVAPADVDCERCTPRTVRGFAPMPLTRFRFPSLVVASTDDSYVTPDRALHFSARWGSEFVSVGALGHINAASDIGDWPEGRALLDRLIRKISAPRPSSAPQA